MGSVSDLTPPQLDAEVAFRAKVAPIGTAWHQQETAGAAARHAAAAEKAVETQQSIEAQIAQDALFRAAVDIFMDQSSGIDDEPRQRAIADRAVRMAKQMRAACRQP